jgi:DNA-binding NarL/FixJ family response regulator
MGHTSIRVLTADDQPLVQAGLTAIIDNEPDMAVVARVSSGSEAINSYRRYRPDVATVDLLLPDMPGETVAARILEEFPDARIVILTSAQGDVHIVRALETGVQGYVLKGMANEDLLDVIRQVCAGRKMIPREVASRIAEHFADDALTPREVQVLRLVASGNRNKEIAEHLSIAEETVRMHMKNIFSKLGAHDRAHAVTIAVTRGIFQLPS